MKINNPVEKYKAKQELKEFKEVMNRQILIKGRRLGRQYDFYIYLQKLIELENAAK